MREWRLASVLSVTLLALSLVGCAAKPKTRLGYFLNINPNSQEQVDKDGIRISVKSITLENYSSFPRIFTNLAAQTPTGPTTLPWVDLNLPAYELTILNDTGHILRFSRSVIRLQDDLGNSYEAAMKADLEDMVDAYAQQFAARQMTIDIPTAKGRIKALKILDQNLELLPGLTEKVYATFNYPQEAAQFLSGKSYLKLMLYEIPVETNDAGEVQKTTNIEFIHDVEARTVGATL